MHTKKKPWTEVVEQRGGRAVEAKLLSLSILSFYLHFPHRLPP
jgi:hypothetical protein